MNLEEIAELTGSTLVNGDSELEITNVAGLDEATASDASFLAKPKFAEVKYASAMKKSAAGVIFITPEIQELGEGRPLLLTEDPSRAFQLLIEAIHKGKERKSSYQGIHPTAIIDATATLAEGVTIGPLAVIEAGVTIGANTFIGAHCTIGLETTIGSECHLYDRVSIRERCQIGNRVTIQSGAVIGSCGFGFLTDENGEHTELKQVGIVKIEDDVNIGANTTIDRARFKETYIGRGAQIDNLVQIAHGVAVGDYSIVVAQSGIAGSTKLGRGVVLAAQTGVAGHLSIADGSIITARSGVSKSLTKPGEKYGGAPAVPLEEYNRNSVLLRRMSQYVCSIKEVKKEVSDLTEKLDGSH